MKIILIGAAGSGKGTQAKLIAEKYNLTHISMGDLLREAAKEDTEQGRQMKEILKTGQLFTKELTLNLIKKKVNNNFENMVFDGYPRSLEQAEALDEVCEPDLVIIIDLPDDVAVERLSNRRQCKACGAITTNEHEKCPNCEGELYQRNDDQPEAIKKRLELFHEETEPLKEYYKPRDMVYEVDGTATREEIFEKICQIIDSA